MKRGAFIGGLVALPAAPKLLMLPRPEPMYHVVKWVKLSHWMDPVTGEEMAQLSARMTVSIPARIINASQVVSKPESAFYQLLETDGEREIAARTFPFRTWAITGKASDIPHMMSEYERQFPERIGPVARELRSYEGMGPMK